MAVEARGKPAWRLNASRDVIDAWLGRDALTRLAVGVWRLASAAGGLALVVPIMNVGRRPYRLGRLADRLEAVRDMAVIPDGLPTQLRWFEFTLVATAAAGLVLPLRLRRAHLLVAVPAFVLAVLVHRGAGQSDWTDPTAQLLVAVVGLGVAVLAALSPVPSGPKSLSG